MKLIKGKALVIAGPQGIGKSGLTRKITRGMSVNWIEYSETFDNFSNGFNKPQVVVISNVPLTKFIRLRSKLKPIIANDQMIVRRKRPPHVVIPTPFIIIELAATLHFDSCATIDERRYTFVKCSAPGWFQKLKARVFGGIPLPKYKVLN